MSMFKGKVAVVTGGASGIGQSCVEVLAARGARVVIADLNEAAASRVAKDTGAAAYRLDVMSEKDIEEVTARIEREVGPVDMLINSAGIIQGNPVPPEELSMDVWDRVVAVDLRGNYLTCLSFGKRMAARGAGSIVNIASVTAIRSAPLHAYAPAKAAVVHMTQCLAAEWGRSGVRVNVISPGYCMTPVIKEAIAQGLRDPRLMEDTSALGRMVMPEEVAKAAAFLLSDDASAITGVNLPVENGWLVATSWTTYGGVRARRRGK